MYHALYISREIGMKLWVTRLLQESCVEFLLFSNYCDVLKKSNVLDYRFGIISSLLIELSSDNNGEFTPRKEAMIAFAKIDPQKDKINTRCYFSAKSWTSNSSWIRPEKRKPTERENVSSSNVCFSLFYVMIKTIKGICRKHV